MENKDAGIYNNGVLAWKQRWALDTFTTTFLKNDDTLFVTFLKNYHRYRNSVPLFGTFQKENFAHFGNNIFGDFMR